MNRNLLTPLLLLAVCLPATQAFGQWFDLPASKMTTREYITIETAYKGEVLLPVENARYETTLTFSSTSPDLLRGRVSSSWPTQASISFVGLADHDRVSLVSSGQGYQVVWTLQRLDDGTLTGIAESIRGDSGEVVRVEAILRPRVGGPEDPSGGWAGSAVPVMPGDTNVKKMAAERRLEWERAAPPNFKPVPNPPLVGRWNSVLRWPGENPRPTTINITSFNGESFTFSMFGRQDANLGRYDRDSGELRFLWGRQTYRARVFQNETGSWQLDGDFTYGIGTNISSGTKAGTLRAIKLQSGEAPRNVYVDVPTGS